MACVAVVALSTCGSRSMVGTSIPTKTPTSVATAAASTLPPPSSVKIEKVVSGAIVRLAWIDASGGKAEFEIQWRFSDVAHWVPLATVPAGQTSHGGALLDKPIARWNNAGYCYRIRAVLNQSASRWSDESCEEMHAGEPVVPPPWPPPPRNVTAIKDGDATRLGWTVTDSSSTIVVLRRLAGSGEYERLASLGAGSSEYVDRATGGLYCYRLATENQRGGSSVSPDVCPT